MILQIATAGLLSQASTGSSFSLSRRATHCPHRSQLLTLILTLPSSNMVSFFSLKSKPTHSGPLIRLYSYQRPQTIEIHDDSPRSSISLMTPGRDPAMVGSSYRLLLVGSKP